MSFSNDFQVINGNRYNFSAIGIDGFNASVERNIFAVPESLPPNVKGVGIDNVVIISSSSTSSSDEENYFTFQVTNGTESLDMLETAVTTDGNEISADSAYSVKPNQNNRNLGAGSVIKLTIGKTGTPTDLSSAEIIVVVYWHWEA